MKFITGDLKGLFIIEPKIFTDDRGCFYETFSKTVFENNTGFSGDFLQDNESISYKNVLRGLHFQTPPFAQAKLVRVTEGEVLDVALDIRKESPTYGQHQSIVLSAENKRTFFIPEGFAHGFVALTERVIFNYKCSDLYHPEAEGGIIWNDPILGIDWKTERPIVSEKDQKLTNFDKFVSLF
jgi:dTDP-4-dehydrorhamnose 3,5-epimerase